MTQEKSYLTKKIHKKFADLFINELEVLLKAHKFKQAFPPKSYLHSEMLVFGYFAAQDNYKVIDSELKIVSKIAANLDLIQSLFIILDNLDDKHINNRWRSAYYTKFGIKNELISVIQALELSANNLCEVLAEINLRTMSDESDLELMLKAIRDMSFKILDELNSGYDEKNLREFIHKAAGFKLTPPLNNNLLFGYYAGNGKNEEVIKMLGLIGTGLGYLLQAISDFQELFNRKRPKGKNRAYSLNSQKNIALILLDRNLTTNDIQKLNKAKTHKDYNSLLIEYFNSYNIKDSFLKEIDYMHQYLNHQVVYLKKLGVSKYWCKEFLGFVDYVITECENCLE